MLHTIRITFCLCFLGVWCNSSGQVAGDSLFTFRVTPYFELGVFPYGYKSIHARSELFLEEDDNEFSRVFGLNISPLPWLALFGEWHSGQFFRSPSSNVEWIPFDPPEMKINTAITHFNSRSEGINMGIMFGGYATDKLSVYLRFGAGTTRHYYSFSYNDGQYRKVTGSTSESNMQLSFVTSYFPIEALGFTNSFSISENLPFWRIGLIGRIDFKVNGRYPD